MMSLWLIRSRITVVCIKSELQLTENKIVLVNNAKISLLCFPRRHPKKCLDGGMSLQRCAFG